MPIREDRLSCFGYSLFFALPLFAGTLLFWLKIVLACISLLFLVVGIFAPQRMQKLLRILNLVFSKVQWLFSQLFLFLFFFVVLTPAAMTMRLFGRNLMSLKVNKHQSSYWSKPAESRSYQQFFKDPF